MANRFHEGKRKPEYMAYLAAKSRCENQNSTGYKEYGGRGIKFLFTSFEQFVECIGMRPSPTHSLDRKDNNLHYGVDNVRWATKSEQLSNRRPYERKVRGGNGFCKHRGKLMVRVRFMGESHYVGLFSSPELARAAYETKQKELRRIA